MDEAGGRRFGTPERPWDFVRICVWALSRELMGGVGSLLLEPPAVLGLPKVFGAILDDVLLLFFRRVDDAVFCFTGSRIALSLRSFVANTLPRLELIPDDGRDDVVALVVAEKAVRELVVDEDGGLRRVGDAMRDARIGFFLASIPLSILLLKGFRKDVVRDKPDIVEDMASRGI